MNDDKLFESKVKAALDMSELSIDADTRIRLAKIRSQSLNASSRHIVPSKWLTLANWGLKSWVPAASLVVFVAFAMLIMVNPKIQSPSTKQQDQVVILELLNDVEDLETATDPDFYLWADEVLAESVGNDAV